MAELPIYALSLWWLLSHFGILGAAIAWTGRMALDFLLLVFFSNAVIPGLAKKSALVVGAVCVGVVLMLGVAALNSFLPKAIACVLIAAMCLGYALRTLDQIRHHD